MNNILTRKVILEKYPPYMIGNIIRTKYKYAGVQEYDKAAEYKKLEIKYFEKHFDVDIASIISMATFDITHEFHKEKNLDKKVDMRIQLLLEEINKYKNTI